MSALTRSNIAYDFNISPHQVTVVYDNQEVKYIFSSDLYRRKFLEKITENRLKINQSLSNRFGFETYLELLCDLKLYSTIEKRGFLLYVNGDKIDCPDNITLSGNNLIMKI